MHSIIFVYMVLYSKGIYLFTSYVQDTALGTVTIARKQVRQALGPSGGR